LYRAFKVAFAEQHHHEISGFRCEVARWRSKLTAIAPVLKWDWDDDGYLVYIPHEESKSVQPRTAFLTEPSKIDTHIKYIGQLTRATPEFKSQRLAYRDILPDQIPAAKSFGDLKLDESLEVSRRNLMSGRE
jgi:hypothetical protein